MSILGLDIGTTGVKAVAFREDGTLLDSAYREYPLDSPRPGHLQLDPLRVLDAIRTVTLEIGGKTRNDPIRSMACSKLGEAAVPVDRDGKALGGAIVGFDARGDEAMQELLGKLSAEEIFSITGHGVNTAHTLFKVMWRRAHEPDVFSRADKFLCFGEYAMASLGLSPRAEHSIAARTLAFDIQSCTWSSRILESAELSSDLFAAPAAPGEVVGTIGGKAADEFGLPAGTIVAAGLHDQPAGILGSGVRPGESMLAIGTVSCLGVRLKAKPTGDLMATNNLCYYPTYGEKQYISIAYNWTGGSLLKWYRDHLAGGELADAERRGVDPYEVITEGLPEEPTGLLVLPHFSMAGTPWLDPKALGAFLGLRLTTTRKEIVKAILEGLLLEIRLNGELLSSSGIEVDLYKAIGGAAKSKVWMQIAADVLNRPVAVTSVTEGAALGVALLGARAAGILGSDSEMEEIIGRNASEDQVLEPRAAHARRYDELFAIYRDLYQTTRGLSHRLFELDAASGD